MCSYCLPETAAKPLEEVDGPLNAKMPAWRSRVRKFGLENSTSENGEYELKREDALRLENA